MQALQNDVTKKTEDYMKERDQLTESMRSSYEKELADNQQKLTQKYQELQGTLRKRTDELIGSIQPQIKEAWQSVVKDGAYVCMNMTTGDPINETVVTPDNLESALKDLFEGRRFAVAIRFSDEISQKVRQLISEKNSNKPVFYMNR